MLILASGLHNEVKVAIPSLAILAIKRSSERPVAVLPFNYSLSAKLSINMGAMFKGFLSSSGTSICEGNERMEDQT